MSAGNIDFNYTMADSRLPIMPSKDGVAIFALQIVGGIIVLVFMCIEGTRGANRFGPDPKQDAMAGVDPWSCPDPSGATTQPVAGAY